MQGCIGGSPPSAGQTWLQTRHRVVLWSCATPPSRLGTGFGLGVGVGFTIRVRTGALWGEIRGRVRASESGVPFGPACLLRENPPHSLLPSPSCTHPDSLAPPTPTIECCARLCTMCGLTGGALGFDFPLFLPVLLVFFREGLRLVAIVLFGGFRNNRARLVVGGEVVVKHGD